MFRKESASLLRSGADGTAAFIREVYEKEIFSFCSLGNGDLLL